MTDRETSLSCVLMAIAGIDRCWSRWSDRCRAQADDKDWPMYNRDVAGSRHNPGETAINASNAGRLEEKWRFPAKDSSDTIGVIHATPVVVNGYVYFGTANEDPTFYKLTPDGKVRWSYRNPLYVASRPAESAAESCEVPRCWPANVCGRRHLQLGTRHRRHRLLRRHGGLDLCTRSRDREGTLEAQHARQGVPRRASHEPLDGLADSRRRQADRRAAARWSNSSPAVSSTAAARAAASSSPSIRKTGKLLWKYDLGPKPEPLDPPITITDASGDHTFYFGPATSSIWSTPSFDAETGTIFFGTDVNTAPRRPTADNKNLHTRESCAVIALECQATAPRNGSRRSTPATSGPMRCGRTIPKRAGTRTNRSATRRRSTRSPWMASRPRSSASAARTAASMCSMPPTAASWPTRRSTPARRRIRCRRRRTRGCSRCPAPSADCRPAARPTARRSSPTASTPCGWRRSSLPCRRAGRCPAGESLRSASDTRSERWRHERPKVPSLGGPPPKAVYTDVGDPVASGIAVANGVVYFTAVASGKLVALDAATWRRAQGDRPRPGLVGPVGLSRPRLHRHRQHAVHPRRLRDLSAEKIHRRHVFLRLARRG